MKKNAKKVALWTAAITGTALFAALVYEKAPEEVKEKVKTKANNVKDQTIGKIGNVLKAF